MIGKTVSHYNILKKLGEGGIGVVYRARDLHLDRVVAIKFLPPSLTTDERIKKQFLQGARAASTLDHPNICQVYEFDQTDDNQMFLVMAYCEGETLRFKIDDGNLKIDEVIKITNQIALGLENAHKNGIIHRDIKPENIIITDDGVVKILDFGLAQMKGDIRDSDDISTPGTPAYMSPEQTMSDSILILI